MMGVSVLALLLAIFCVLTREFGCCWGDSILKKCSPSDLLALDDFKKGLDDPANRLSTWQGSNCCQWHGISCDNRTGAIISIDLHNSFPLIFRRSSTVSRYGSWSLGGEISPSLLKLEELTAPGLEFQHI